MSRALVLGFTIILSVGLCPAGHAASTKASLSKASKKISKVVSKSGLNKIPSASAALSSNSSSSDRYFYPASVMDVSGTPPTLQSIASLGAENVFWRPGVVDAIATGSPDQVQCNEFFSSTTDGFSGGIGACRMAEGVGHSFQTIVDSSTSLCYMQNFPTKANLAAGAITLVKGKFPSNDITKLFVPGKTARLVKIDTPKIGGEGLKESIFVKVSSTAENEKAGNLYKSVLYFCPEDADEARGYNIIQLTNAGVLKVTLADKRDPFHNEGHLVTIQGTIEAVNGALAWQTAKSRKASVQVDREEDDFKVDFQILSTDRIVTKRRQERRDGPVKEYNISKFLGTDAMNAIFTAGAFKGLSESTRGTREIVGATEYRDTFYASAPNSSLYSEVQSFNFSGDSFYSTAPGVSVSIDRYSCRAKANIVAVMNNNETLQNALQPCQNRRFRDQNFCRTAKLQLAESNYVDACVGPPGDGGGGNGGGGGGGPPG